MINSKQVKEWQDAARKEGKLEILLDILQFKFGKLPAKLTHHLQSIDQPNVVKHLIRQAALVDSLDDFQFQIPKN